MPDKIDDSPEDEAIKEAAREFMSNMVGTEDNTSTTAPEDVDAATAAANGKLLVHSFKDTYNASPASPELLETFWSTYDPATTSVWTMKYDEADSNESEEQTIEIITSFLKEPGMEGIKDQCFAVIHTLESLEMEGLWFFVGADPEPLFGANPESSWYTFTQLGPQKMEEVKTAIAKLLTPADNKVDGKEIKNTQVF